MRHRKAGRKFGRNPAQRRALLRHRYNRQMDRITRSVAGPLNQLLAWAERPIVQRERRRLHTRSTV